MRDRWIAVCRRLVPPALRQSAFDPAVADLLCAAAERPSGSSRHRVWLREAQIASKVLSAAFECRRLQLVSPRPAAASSPSARGAAMWTDLRDACRRFVRAPGTAIIVVLILAAGIGVNVTVFSFANAYLLSSMPVDDPSQLVRVYGRTSSREFDVISYPDYRDIRNGVTTLDLAAHAESPVQLGVGDTRRTVTAELVSGNFFEVMRLRPLLGRLVSMTDDQTEGASPVVVIGEALWRSQFLAREGMVGTTVSINGAPFHVIGIAPAHFRGASNAYAISDLWVPLSMHDQVRPRGSTRENRNWGWLSMVGRRRGDAPMPAVHAELERIGLALGAGGRPEERTTYVAVPASTLPESDRQGAARVLALAGALTGLVLLAACANLAGIMQARLAGRRKELAVRQALGASRHRLARMWMFEMLLVAGLGGAAGLGAGRLVAVLVDRWRPPAALLGDLSLETTLDWRVVAFTTVVAMACAVAVGLAPALRAGRLAAWPWLKAEGVTLTPSRGVARIRGAMVAVQVAISVVLLLAGALLVRSALALNRVDLGFDPSGLVLAGVDLRTHRVPADEGRRAIAGAIEQVRTMPGVSAAAVANSLPLGFGKERWQIRVPGYVPPAGAKSMPVNFNRVGRTYFETMGISVRQGTVWHGSLESTAGPVVVINDTMAKRFWAGRDPVGLQLEVVGRGMLTVVGVASDSIYYELGEAPLPFMYLPAETFFPETLVVIARTAGTVDRLLPQIDRAMVAVDPRIAPARLGAFEEVRRVPLYPARAFAAIAVVFGSLVLLLTAVGLYGVVASIVTQRTREIGVRMALGARAGQVVASILRDAALLTATGAAAGLLGGYFTTGLLRGLLYGVDAVHPPTYLLVAVTVAVVVGLAALVPARQAARIDPVAALKTM